MHLRNFVKKVIVHVGKNLLVFIIEKLASQGVAGAAIEHPLEGVAEDPAWVGYKKEKPACAGLTLRVGRG